MRTARRCLYCSQPRMGHGSLICQKHWTEIFGEGGTYPQKPPVVNHEYGKEMGKLLAAVEAVEAKRRPSGP